MLSLDFQMINKERQQQRKNDPQPAKKNSRCYFRTQVMLHQLLFSFLLRLLALDFALVVKMKNMIGQTKSVPVHNVFSSHLFKFIEYY